MWVPNGIVSSSICEKLDFVDGIPAGIVLDYMEENDWKFTQEELEFMRDYVSKFPTFEYRSLNLDIFEYLRHHYYNNSLVYSELTGIPMYLVGKPVEFVKG